MAQKLVQTQTIAQTQTLAPQQLLLVRMLELPVTELSDRIHDELMDNEALEEADSETYDSAEETGGQDADSGDAADESAHDDALADYLNDDDVPDYLVRRSEEAGERAEIPIGTVVTFHETLLRQMGESDLDDHTRELLEYLIGSLDDDGFLRRDLESLVDELAIYHNVTATVEELERALHILQDFEPRGIGARTLQECLLLQLRAPEYRSPYRKQEIEIMERCYTDFVRKNWTRIAERIGADEETMEHIRASLRRLNPRPGSALDEPSTATAALLVPDFVVENGSDGIPVVRLNSGDVPELRVSRSFRQSLETYAAGQQNLSREQRDAYLYTKRKIDAARGFIEAVRQRRITLLATMEAIVDLQRPFFEEGDEAALRPMILKDVAVRAGLDISTVSRVTNGKYVETEFGIYPLKFFFNDKFSVEGKDLSTLAVKNALKSLVGSEDSTAPMTDDELALRLKEQGFPVARRTVAKYREQLGIPVARLRR